MPRDDGLLLDRRIVAHDLERDDGDVVLAAAAVRGLDQRLDKRVEIAALLLDQAQDLVVLDHRRQAVGAEQEEVARARLDREVSTSTSGSVPTARVIIERCG